MEEFVAGDRVKVTRDIIWEEETILKKGLAGIVTKPNDVVSSVVFENLGNMMVNNDNLKKKVRKVEKLVKAKNVRLSDEVFLPGYGGYDRVGNIFRVEYDAEKPKISIETVVYDSHEYDYNELVSVRR